MSATKTRKPKADKVDVYQEVTDKVIAALEAGVIPWSKPWRPAFGDNAHRNLSSKKAYRGINVFLLDLAAMTEGYESPYWITFKQARDLAYKQWLRDEAKKDTDEHRAHFDKNVTAGVRKGEKSTMVVFFKPIKIKEKGKDGVEKDKVIPLLKYYRVFNIEQCDGVPAPVVEEVEEFKAIDKAQQILDEMPQRPKLRHSGDRAYYSPMTDSVTLPKRENFKAPEHYYGTAFHEMVHATGHESRIGRIKDWATFGTEPYAQEELVAEMGAAMLCGVARVEVPIEHNAAYVSNWLTKLNNDKKLVVMAASQAQKAADFIQGITPAPTKD